MHVARTAEKYSYLHETQKKAPLFIFYVCLTLNDSINVHLKR